jgi:DNA-binding NtrC family response regulator
MEHSWDPAPCSTGDPTTGDIPVIVISADAKEYLTKPLDIHRFLQVLDGALKKRELDQAER